MTKVSTAGPGLLPPGQMVHVYEVGEVTAEAVVASRPKETAEARFPWVMEEGLRLRFAWYPGLLRSFPAYSLPDSHRGRKRLTFLEGHLCDFRSPESIPKVVSGQLYYKEIPGPCGLI